MANTTLKTRIILNNKTEAEWNANATFVPLKGELCVFTDIRKGKIGDGVTTIADIPFAWLTSEDVDQIIGESSHFHTNKAVLDATTASFTTALKDKLDKIANGAEVNVQSDWNVTDDASDAFIKNKPTSMPASDVPDWAKAANKPKYTYDEVGADQSGAAAKALTDAKDYTDTKIGDLINGAPETMDTLKEISDAFATNKEVVDALNGAIGNKANASDLTAHTSNNDIHVTKAKKDNWDAAYTHSQAAHAPSNAERNVIVGIQVNGTDVTPDTNRKVNVTVSTDIDDITGLQEALDGKASTDHGTHVTYATVAPKAAGTAAVGTSAKVAREDHVHPLQTNVSGNAGSATKLANARNIGVGGIATGTAASFDGSASATINVSSINAGGLVQTDGDVLILDGGGAN